MKGEKRALLILLVICMMSALSLSMTKVTAASQYINPSYIIPSAGSRNSTDLNHIAANDGTAIKFSSNSSGDKNYYESYKINNTSDFNTYFNYPVYDKVTVSVVDEKKDAAEKVHKNAIRIYDGNKDPYYNNQSIESANEYIQQNAAINNASVNKTSGWVEFYFLSESTNGTFMFTFGDYNSHRFAYGDYWHKPNYGISFGIMPLNGSTSQFFCKTNWSSIPIQIPTTKVSYHPNIWYHVRLNFTRNVSWSVILNNQNVFTASNWFINPALKYFDCVSMFTSTQTTASYLPSHVFYIDAIGISYNMSKQNQYSSTMKFDTTYTEYVNPNSHNDLNDHVLNASLAVYFLFTIPNYNSNSTIITKLHIAGYYKNVVTSGKLYLFNQRYKIYDAFDLTYFPYAGTPMSKDAEYDFKNGSTFPDINPRIYINNNTGAFSLKIEAQGNTFFEFVLNYMALESYVMVDNSTTVIIVILVLSFIAAIILVKIVQRGGGFRNIRKRVQRRGSKGSRGR